LLLLPFFLSYLAIKKNSFLHILFWGIIFIETQPYFLNLFDFFSNSLSKTNFNFLLKNNLNKIHPFLFYYGLVFFNVYFSFLVKIKKNFYYIAYADSSKAFFLTHKSIFLSSSALFLGAWWAFQEGSWGGWWNWDPSETLSLVSVSLLFFFLF